MDKQNWQTISQTHQAKGGEKSTNLEKWKRREITADNTEIQRIIRDHYEQLYILIYTNKMDKLEEMDRCLEKFKLPRLNQGEIEIRNKLITSTEI